MAVARGAARRRRNQRRRRPGTIAARVVVGGRARHRAIAGRAQPRQRRTNESTRERGRQLALALHGGSAVHVRIRVAAEGDAGLVSIRPPRHAGDGSIFSNPRDSTGDARMKATTLLHGQGQSLWLDNITRDLLQNGTLARYIAELSVTGLTSNPTIFDHAIKNSTAYDAAIRQKVDEGKSGEDLFFELALEDLTRAADLFRPIWDRTHGVDGWVSLEVSPLLAHDTASTLAAAKDLHARAGRPNLFIKIPGTKEGLPAIEEAIFAGIPINVTLLFSPRAIPRLRPTRSCAASSAAWRRASTRRSTRSPRCSSAGGTQRSRRSVPPMLRNQLGIAIAKRTYKAYRDLLGSPRWQRVFNAGARPQRLLWASTGTKDPNASDVLYISSACRAVHREHHARGHPEGARRSWRARRITARRRRRQRRGPGAVRCCRRRRRCACRATPGGRREVVRQLLARAHGCDRLQERCPGDGKLRVDDRQTASDDMEGRPMTQTTTELLPLTARPAWKALEAHYEKIRRLHLRTLFADDATRGERLTAEGGRPLSRLLEEPRHGRDARAARAAWPRSPACASASTRCSAATRST